MSTTTIRLPAPLKARIERLAAERGSTPHAFIVEAVAELADEVEREHAFVAEADRRLKKMARTGRFLSLDDVRNYALALARGEQPEPPNARVMPPEELARFRAALRRR